MLVLAFDRQAGVDPVLFAADIILHVCIAECRQFTGGFFRCRSAGLGAIDHDFGVFVRKKAWREFLQLVWRQIDRSRQMGVFECDLRERFD
jgi:hypothetical protein